MSRHAVAAACGLAAVAWALVVPIAAGGVEPGYSHVEDYISELGAEGAANAALVSWAGFAPIGLLVLGFAALAAPHFPGRRARVWVAAGLVAVGAGYLGAAAFPCDAGCPSDGSPSQAIHNAFGFLEYAGAGGGLLLLGLALRREPRWRGVALASTLAAVVVLGGLVGMLAPALVSQRGLVQRVAEAAIFGWIALVSVVVWRRGRA
jgi:hypothetical protein